MTPGTVHVAVAVIVDDQDRVLVARRHVDSHQGGLWEFPGGKLEAEESPLHALRRECREELNIQIETAFPFKKIFHDYGDKVVLLDVWRVSKFNGEATGMEGQPLKWQLPSELSPQEFPVANRPIIKSLQLPSYMAITPALEEKEQLQPLMASYAQQGIKLVQLRQKQLPASAYLEWFEFAAHYGQQLGMQLLFNHDQASYAASLASGRHVSAGLLDSLQVRPVGEGQLFSASCHNLAELHRAQELQADFATLSPVAATDKYEAANLLGWEQFAALRRQVSMPVYALGGLGRGDLAQARRSGADGIAGISLFLQEAIL